MGIMSSPWGSVPVADVPGAPTAGGWLQTLANPLASCLLCQLPLGDGCHGCLHDGAVVGVGVGDEHGLGCLVDLLSIEPGGGMVCPPVPLCQVGELCQG